MFNIAICDGAAKELLVIMEQLDTYRKEFYPQAEIATDVYSRADDLIAGFHEKKYNLLIFDMDGMKCDGIRVAREIKEIEERVDIIFISSGPDRAIDAFSVNALAYLLRPYTKERFFEIMSRAFRRLPSPKPEGIAVKNLSGTLMSVDVKDILYVESREKIIRIVQKNSDDILVRSSLSNTYERLGKFRHIMKCGGSYIINLDDVKAIEDRTVLMTDGTAIPVPRRLMSEVKTRYETYRKG